MNWLPKNPDFPKDLNAAKKSPPEEAWQRLTAIARHDLGFLETLQLDRLLQEKFRDAPPPSLDTRPVSLALLGSCTVEQLLPGIRVGALRHGLWVSIYITDYGQSLQELEDPSSRLHRFKPNTILVALDAFSLFGTQPLGLTAESASAKLRGALDRVQTLWRLSQEHFACRVIQQTPLPLFHPLMGQNDQRLPDSPYHLLRVFNAELRGLADAQKVDILDIDHWASMDGLREWHNPVLWHEAKQEVSPAAAPFYGELAGRLLAAQQGRTSKCLVLDLDNTLWGGVVGDDGVEGLRLGQGSGLGESFVAFQKFARDLADRGVLLAVCSKNDEKNAWEPFDRHPEMVLKRPQIACFVANWNDKASNLREIARKLNIGLDSLVFADDNPYERNQVRQELPMVAVPELPEDPALYPACIAAAGYFEAVALTSDDLARTGQYQKNLERERAQASFGNLSDYLQSLGMELLWGPFDALSLPRVTQLINKTNQFNLTTRRYSEEETRRFASDPRTVTLRYRLTDRFGDNGIIGVIIAVPGPEEDWVVDTWLMSCRVLGRGVEQAMADLLCREVAERGGKRIIGLYLPTEKNQMVKGHYAGLGFEILGPDEKGGTRWVLNLGSPKKFEYPIQLKKGN